MARKSSIADKLRKHRDAAEKSKPSQKFYSTWPKDLVAMAYEAVDAVRSGAVSMPHVEVARFIISEVRGKVKKLPAVDTVARWVSESLAGIR